MQHRLKKRKRGSSPNDIAVDWQAQDSFIDPALARQE